MNQVTNDPAALNNAEAAALRKKRASENRSGEIIITIKWFRTRKLFIERRIFNGKSAAAGEPNEKWVKSRRKYVEKR